MLLILIMRKPLASVKIFIPHVQSHPIEMRATILYLANRWIEFEMLLTPHRFLYLVMFSLLAFPSIPQFIAHFWQICSFLCTALPFSNSYRNESCSKACTAHYANAQCARSLILLEKWGVKTFISSMQSGLLGTISSHSGVKLVSFHHLFQS